MYLAIALVTTVALGSALVVTVPFGVVSVAIAVAVFIYPTALAMRRMFWAIGTDWIYVRRTVYRPGQWVALSDITNVSVVTIGRNLPYLRVMSGTEKSLMPRRVPNGQQNRPSSQL
ncbi:hypothetical protein [Rudaeicoccus suwonensis]|uniref:Uncharacterized protein n=1 Tax=Rudaeicoccus suwonensis TaxID=657409 RepID=A0A561ECJ5_9MICO|nr:hypothetical protein [Rudaeicoccus suwonensis]TWE13336.1 hypothetical protein BKA23_2165 [Rudaeicoccus suwonensis]